MNSALFEMAKPEGEFRYYQIVTQPLFEMIRGQMGGLVTGNVTGKPLYSHYDSVALAVLQKTMDHFTQMYQGFNLDENELVFPRQYARNLLPDDEADLITAGTWFFATALSELIPENRTLEYPILYRVTDAGNLIVGIDTRDLINESGNDPLLRAQQRV